MVMAVDLFAVRWRASWAPRPVAMENGDQRVNDEMVRVTLDLPISVLVWLDALKDQIGLRSRGALVAHLLMELRDLSELQEETPLPESA